MENNNAICRVVIIDPSPIVSSGLKALIEQHRGYRIIHTLSDCSRYTERVVALRPDVVIINPLIINYKRRNCIEETFPGLDPTKFVALVYQYVEPEALKNFQVVIDISDDDVKIRKKLQQALEAGGEESDDKEREELSEREREILVAIAKGMTNKEIANVFSLSVHTIITHRKNIIRKTGIHSISGLTVFAILNNMVDIKDIE